YWSLCFFFFFFQAEDGIRDLTVTGVQTCALPISGRALRRRLRRPRERPAAERLPRLVRDRRARHRQGRQEEVQGRRVVRHDVPRSEERRVGKEWRAWWTTYH